ncbi:MAG: hypothetical protein IKG81_05250 [Bacteroidales bacterium]|nr:hypothetical protein [Bacteroidales bacterium]
MYTLLKFFDNSCKAGEKKVNPVNMSITPSQIATLTSEGRSISMHQLDGSLFFPNVADGVMPMEFQRGVDMNDCWEASENASEKVRRFAKEKFAKGSTSHDGTKGD